MASQDNGSVGVSVFPPGSFWYLHLAAPAGQPLVPGVYEGARRFQSASDPGLDFFGDGRGCNMLTGRFEVLEAVYGPLGYVERFHATFEQHCEEAEPALFGEVGIVNPPPPPALAISLGIDPDGGVRRTSGVATIGGTVACAAGTTLNVSGTLMQRTTRFAVATGWFYASASCSEVLSSWSVEIVPSGDVPFGAGAAEARVTAVGFDPNYGTHVTTDVTSLIRLTGGQR